MGSSIIFIQIALSEERPDALTSTAEHALRTATQLHDTLSAVSMHSFKGPPGNPGPEDPVGLKVPKLPKCSLAFCGNMSQQNITYLV